MKRLFVLFILGIAIIGCSASKDTTLMSPKEHFDYALGYYTDEDYQTALNEFQSILLQYPGTAVNDDAQYYLGMTYFKREQYLLAAYEFSKLIKNIPASPFVAMAQFQLAESYYQLSPFPELEQSYTKKAIEEFQAFIDFFPMSDKVDEAEKKINEMNEKLAQKKYSNAVIYEKMSYYNAALKYFGEVADEYHDTKFGPLALHKKIDILLMKERIDEARTNIAIFLNRYPNHESADEVRELEVSLVN